MNTISIPIDAATEAALDKIAAATKRSREDIVAEALAGFARQEAELVKSILQAQVELRSGKGISHEEVMESTRRIIDRARSSD